MENLKRLAKYIREKKSVQLQLGSYDIISQLGQGGNGIVYEAQIVGKIVALKFLVTDTRGDSSKRKLDRFVAEYFNVKTLEDSTFIIQYIDFDILHINDAAILKYRLSS